MSKSRKLSRLELFLMGKGPSAAAARGMYKDSLKNPSARTNPSKGRG